MPSATAHGLPETPCLTADLPGIGGVIKQEPGDFEVEEIPAYEPCGRGEHLFLWIEKRDTGAEELVRHLARMLDVSASEIGTAGLKDRRAVTRQYVSVPAECVDRIGDVDTGHIRVLDWDFHANKLRRGHLRGNRFSILVRDVEDDALSRAEAVRDELARSGFPNYFGTQRFGDNGETLAIGLDLLRGNKTAGDLPRGRRRFLQRLALSAAQSALFNRTLAVRMTDGLLHRVLPGDVMQVRASGGLFNAEELPAEQQRFDERETVATGPMFGVKMRHATGEAGTRERCVLETAELTIDNFREFKRLIPGVRRPYLVYVDDLTIDPEPEGLRFRFTLPPGAYATVLLHEFCKADPSEET